MDVFILLFLILLNGFFAMSEMALVAAKKGRLLKLSQDGDIGATVAIKLGEDSTKFMSAVQIGMTTIGILNGIFGESILAEPIDHWLIAMGMSEHSASITSIVLAVLIITYLTIVIGELVPKRIGQIKSESIARFVSRPMSFLALCTRPFVFCLTKSTNGLLHLMGLKELDNANEIEEEFHALLNEGSESGMIEQDQHTMLRNVFRLDGRQLNSLMIPRSDVVYLDTRLSYQENLSRLMASSHTRFPVCEGELDNVIGVIHVKQALFSKIPGQEPDITAELQECLYVPETLTGMELLSQFRENNMQMAFVIDEYGEINGLISLKDLLEAVTGEFTPKNEDDAWAVQREDGSWLLDGSIPILEMKDRLNIKDAPEEDKGSYHTLGGMLMLLLGRVPLTCDRIEWADWLFEIVDMDKKRIDKVLVSKIEKI
jgi:Hemolysins and related proteins containing CBS domains